MQHSLPRHSRAYTLFAAAIIIAVLPFQLTQSAPPTAAANGFCDSFAGTNLNSGWQWVDPLGDTTYSLTENPGRVRLSAARGNHDLYSNYNAPRLLQAIEGDFTATTKVTIDPKFNYQGAGLLLWQDEDNYLRLERTLVSGIDLWYKTAGVYSGKEVSFSSADSVFLKLQRVGSTFTASYSTDNTSWEQVFAVTYATIGAQLQVGLILANQWQDNPVYADFDFFQLNSCATSEYKVYTPVILNQYTSPLAVPILAMAYYPPASSNPLYLDAIETGLADKRISDLQIYVQQLIDDGVDFVSDATRYHGYKNPNAPMSLRYSVSKKIEYMAPIPRGFVADPTKTLWDLATIMRDIDVCNYVDSFGLKEVWIYGYESSFVQPSESKMSSRYGDISNSIPDEALPEVYRLPRCTNSYVVYSFNYGRNLETNIHNRMHQIENVMGYLDDTMFWDDFSERIEYGYQHTNPSSCAATHYAPNWSDARADQYVYNLQNYHLSNCETWDPDDSKTTYVSINCTQWGCTELGYYKWFMQNIPGKDNGITYNGKQMRNWWEAMYDFNAYVDKGRGFFAP